MKETETFGTHVTSLFVSAMPCLPVRQAELSSKEYVAYGPKTEMMHEPGAAGANARITSGLFVVPRRALGLRFSRVTSKLTMKHPEL